MNKEEFITDAKARIIFEYRKHPEADWAGYAAAKIAGNLCIFDNDTPDGLCIEAHGILKKLFPDYNLSENIDVRRLWNILAEMSARHRYVEKNADRKFKEWENQRNTIRNFHDVCRKHFPEMQPDSDELDKKLSIPRIAKIGLTETIPFQCCPVCRGFGEVQPIENVGANNAMFVPCTVCDGKKVILEHVIEIKGEPITKPLVCTRCNAPKEQILTKPVTHDCMVCGATWQSK